MPPHGAPWSGTDKIFVIGPGNLHWAINRMQQKHIYIYMYIYIVDMDLLFFEGTPLYSKKGWPSFPFNPTPSGTEPSPKYKYK